MQALLEIKDILNKLNEREKKAAKKYFTMHYSNTKELQLLNLIEKAERGKNVNLENRIIRMGYTSAESKSFNKLKSRLKQKLFDYLVSTVSINELRNIDNHSFLKHRLRKLLFQSGILLEKGFFLQAAEMLRTCLRLAQDYEQFSEIVESLEMLRRIELIKGNLREQDNLFEKIRHFQDILESFREAEFRFNRFISEYDQVLLNRLSDRCQHLNSEFDQLTHLKRFERFMLMMEFLFHLQLRTEGKSREAALVLTRRIKAFRHESMRYSVRHKTLFTDALFELMHATDHSQIAERMLKWEEVLQRPAYLMTRLNNLHATYLLTSGKQSIGFELNNRKEDDLFGIYTHVHFLFLSGKYRKCLIAIDDNIRKYSIQSTLQLDLMLLELMIYFELKKIDLLEYKLPSYLKNLAYRGKYDVPGFYHEAYKALHLLVRLVKNNNIGDALYRIELPRRNDFLSTRSVQPAFLERWFSERARMLILENLNDNSLNQVA